jgi:hypothetical protein
VTWGPGELGDVAANRDAAFPPLHDEADDGCWDTVIQARVPYLVNSHRWSDLLESLRRWAEDQGLADFLAEDETGIGYGMRPEPKIKEGP